MEDQNLFGWLKEIEPLISITISSLSLLIAFLTYCKAKHIGSVLNNHIETTTVIKNIGAGQGGGGGGPGGGGGGGGGGAGAPGGPGGSVSIIR